MITARGEHIASKYHSNSCPLNMCSPCGSYGYRVCTGHMLCVLLLTTCTVCAGKKWHVHVTISSIYVKCYVLYNLQSINNFYYCICTFTLYWTCKMRKLAILHIGLKDQFMQFLCVHVWACGMLKAKLLKSIRLSNTCIRYHFSISSYMYMYTAKCSTCIWSAFIKKKKQKHCEWNIHGQVCIHMHRYYIVHIHMYMYV